MPPSSDRHFPLTLSCFFFPLFFFFLFSLSRSSLSSSPSLPLSPSLCLSLQEPQLRASTMPPITRRLLVLVPCIILVLVAFFRYQAGPKRIYIPHAPHQEPAAFDGAWSYQRDRNNLHLTHEQCDQAFPDLFVEIERASAERKSRPITLKEIDSIPQKTGYVRAMIYDGEVSFYFCFYSFSCFLFCSFCF